MYVDFFLMRVWTSFRVKYSTFEIICNLIWPFLTNFFSLLNPFHFHKKASYCHQNMCDDKVIVSWCVFLSQFKSYKAVRDLYRHVCRNLPSREHLATAPAAFSSCSGSSAYVLSKNWLIAWASILSSFICCRTYNTFICALYTSIVVFNIIYKEKQLN